MNTYTEPSQIKEKLEEWIGRQVLVYAPIQGNRMLLAVEGQLCRISAGPCWQVSAVDTHLEFAMETVEKVVDEAMGLFNQIYPPRIYLKGSTADPAPATPTAPANKHPHGLSFGLGDEVFYIGGNGKVRRGYVQGINAGSEWELQRGAPNDRVTRSWCRCAVSDDVVGGVADNLCASRLFLTKAKLLNSL